jgi:hypothetical protein
MATINFGIYSYNLLNFAGNVLAQTDININNTNLVRFGGSVSVPANQTVENASSFGGKMRIILLVCVGSMS